MIKAQIGYKRRPGKYGGTPAVVAQKWLHRPLGRDPTLSLTRENPLRENAKKV